MLVFHGILWDLASGKHTKSYGKSPCSMGKSAISMAMFNSYLFVYQRVKVGKSWQKGCNGTISCKTGDIMDIMINSNRD